MHSQPKQFTALLLQNVAAFQAIVLLQNRLTRCKRSLFVNGILIVLLKVVTLVTYAGLLGGVFITNSKFYVLVPAKKTLQIMPDMRF